MCTLCQRVQTELIILVFSHSIFPVHHDGSQRQDGFTRQRLLKKVKVCEKCGGGGRTIRGNSCLVFFPAAGRSQQPICADRKWRAPVCRPCWRQSGLKNQCSRNQHPHLLFFHPSSPSFSSESKRLNLFMWFSPSLFPFVRLQRQGMGDFFAYCYQVILP